MPLTLSVEQGISIRAGWYLDKILGKQQKDQKHIMRYWSIAGMLWLLSCGVVAQDNWVGQFASDVKREVRQRNIPGYAFAVVSDPQREQVFTYGNRTYNGQPINGDTLFRLASVSKTFTSALTTKLVEQGKLQWSLPVSKLAPDYPFLPELANTLTLNHIISQSSGYMPNAYDNLIEANYSVKRVLNELAGLQPICKPGQCYTYQNALFGVVAEGLDQGLHQNYGQLLTQHLLLPLDMQRTSIGRTPLVGDDNWAEPHVLIGRGKWRKVKVREDYYRFAPAAGINTSIKDMTQWLRLMLGYYPHILSDYAIEEMISPRVRTSRELYRRHWRDHLNDAHYGLGWRIYDFDGERLAHHGGWVKGYRADISFAPDHGVGLILLMNAESNLVNEIIVNFWRQHFELAKIRGAATPVISANTESRP
ncbi:serine hydrolase domain-containing protein [Lacimicrobium sp. SS2-24]|uniref:serine hydrolase domain-containing protein n=1 Tax=Lacimicrobium sp. SS2-24 TaxID=2005569 RepID=UPI001FF041CC|nr:serine hydrolase domain-containing protein [Lacimicrobium sp. SS2-24]